MASISDFKANMFGGGARPNQFICRLTFPRGGADAGTATFLCKTASIPASDIEPIQLMYRGRPVNFAGERTFQPWSVTVINEGSFEVRAAFEKWIEDIGNAESSNGLVEPSDYQTELQVTQLDRADQPIRTYTFHDAFPINVGQIALSWDSNNQIEEYEVTFQYNWFSAGTSPA
jgi:hypothetical protein